MSTRFTIHAPLADKRKYTASLMAYKQPMEGKGFCLTITSSNEGSEVFGDSVDIHRMEASDIWQLTNNLTTVAMEAEQKEKSAKEGCAGCGGPLDDNDSCPSCMSNVQGTQSADDAHEQPQAVDIERVTRLVQNAEQLLLFCKHTLCPPPGVDMNDVSSYLDWNERQALKMIRLIEPEISDDLEEARTMIFVELQKRGKAAFPLNETGATD